MKRLQDLPWHFALKMQVYPSQRQKQVIDKNIDFARFYWNTLVDKQQQIARLRHDKTFLWPWADERIAQLEAMCQPNCRYLKQVYPFANDKDLDSDNPMSVKRHYQAAWNLWRKVPGVKAPTFHKKGAAGSYHTYNHYQPKKVQTATPFNGNVKLLDGQHLFLSKVGKVRCAFSPKRYDLLQTLCAQGIEIRLTSACIRRDACGDYFVTLQLSSTQPLQEKYPAATAAIGVDFNVENLYTDSEGRVVANPRWRRRVEEKLGFEQRRLSRRRERARKEQRPLHTAKNYQRQRVKVARLHRRIERQRRDYLERTTTEMVKNHGLIAVEELQVKNMLRNHCLARAIAEVGMRQARTMLERKAKEHGRTVVPVNPRHTTQRCSVCGYVLQGSEKLTLGQRRWVCPHCGAVHNRDENSAQNVLQRALAAIEKNKSAGNERIPPS